MSNTQLRSTAGSMPSVPTMFVTDNGTAVPALNELDINGKSSSQNNTNGIIVKGGVVGTGSSKEVDIVITNRVTGSTTTVDVATSTVLSFDTSIVGLAGVYDLQIQVQAVSIATNSAAAYLITGAILAKADLTLLTIGTPTISINGTSSFVGNEITVSFVGGIIEVEVTGLIGKNITWNALLNYVFGGA